MTFRSTTAEIKQTNKQNKRRCNKSVLFLSGWLTPVLRAGLLLCKPMQLIYGMGGDSWSEPGDRFIEMSP